MKPFAEPRHDNDDHPPTSGTDHLAFDAVGLPGFQFVQDPMEYSSRTHHTNLDLYERADAGGSDAERGDRGVVRLSRPPIARRCFPASRCPSRSQPQAGGGANIDADN